MMIKRLLASRPIQFLLNYTTFLVLGLVVLASSWALFQPELFRVHDYIHGARIAEMTRALNDGHFPVRWTPNFGYGYGMPLFEFYAPLPYYFGSFWYWLTANMTLSVKLILLTANLLTAWGAFRLGKKWFGYRGGWLLSILLTLAPYRAVNIFVRGAVSEAWGLMALPWILWSVVELIPVKIFAQDVLPSSESKLSKSGWGWLVFWLSVLVLSHNLTTLMFVPVSGAVTGTLLLIRWKQMKISLSDWRIWLFESLYVLAAYLLAFGLTSFYTIPALMEKGFTQIERILSGYFYFSHHFLYIRQWFQVNWGYGGSAWGPDDGLSFFLGFSQILGLVIGAASVIWALLTKRIKLFSNHFWMLVVLTFSLLGSLYLTLLKSQWFWELIPFLSFIQFPWRWLSVSVVMVAVLVTAGWWYLPKGMFKVWTLAVLSLLAFGNAQYFQPESYLENSEDLYYSDQARIRQEMSSILPDYMPLELNIATENQPADSDFETSGLETRQAETVAWVSEAGDLEEGDDFKVLLNNTHQTLVSWQNPEATSQVLTFGRADFPGWQAEVDGESVEVGVSNQGLVTVEVPAGQHQIGVFFGQSPVRFWSDLVSAMSVLIVIWLSVTPLSLDKRISN